MTKNTIKYHFIYKLKADYFLFRYTCTKVIVAEHLNNITIKGNNVV